MEKQKIEQLNNYYKDNNLLIVGLNDSQGVNTTSTFFKKGLLEYLASSLTSKDLQPEVINAFSLLMNKTEHINYFLENNLSLEEIKLSQIYSVVSAFEKVMIDIGFPKFIGQLGNVYRLIYTPKIGDENIKISSKLKNANEPILIYSSGVNNLMREVGSNPFSAVKNYKKRDETPCHYYSLDKAKNPETLKKVIDGIDRNFESILRINSNTDVYTLGSYIPKSFQNEGMEFFIELVNAYNTALQNLCKQYDITFIDTEEVGKKYNNSESNFHVSTAGHNALANYILEHIYQNKIILQNNEKRKNESDFNFTDNGSEGIINYVNLDYEQSYNRMMELDGYAKERELAIANEHIREKEVFEKVLSKKSSNVKKK